MHTRAEHHMKREALLLKYWVSFKIAAFLVTPKNVLSGKIFVFIAVYLGLYKSKDVRARLSIYISICMQNPCSFRYSGFRNCEMPLTNDLYIPLAIIQGLSVKLLSVSLVFRSSLIALIHKVFALPFTHLANTLIQRASIDFDFFCARVYVSRKDMMLAAMGTPGYLTFPRWASTSTVRLHPCRTPPARTSSLRTFLRLTSPCPTAKPATPTLTWVTRLISTRYTSPQHRTSSSHGPDGRLRRSSELTDAAGSPVPFWASRARPGCAGMPSGDQSFSPRTASSPWPITLGCTSLATG